MKKAGRITSRCESGIKLNICKVAPTSMVYAWLNKNNEK